MLSLWLRKRQKEKECPFLRLPGEIFDQIFAHLDIYQLTRVSQTCRRWRYASASATSLYYDPDMPNGFLSQLPVRFPLLKKLHIKLSLKNDEIVYWHKQPMQLRHVMTNNLTILPALLKCPRLTSLHIACPYGKSNFATMLRSAMLNLVPRLTSLSLQGGIEGLFTVKLPDDKMDSGKTIAHELRSMTISSGVNLQETRQFLACFTFPKLEYLILTHTFFSFHFFPHATQWSVLIEQLSSIFPNLKDLTLGPIGWESLKHLPSNLEALSMIIQLGGMEGIQVVPLSHIFGHQKGLKKLLLSTMSKVKLVDDMEDIHYPSLNILLLNDSSLKRLERFPNLRTVSLKISDKEAAEVLTSLEMGCSLLEQLTLAVQGILSWEPKDISVPMFPRLKHFSIDVKTCHDVGIIRFIIRHPQLENFVLKADNIIKSEPVTTHQCPNIKVVKIHVLRAEQGVAIFPLFIHSCKLASLDVRTNDIWDKPFARVADFPSCWPSLTYLSYVHNISSSILSRWISQSSWGTTLSFLRISMTSSVQMWSLLFKFIESHSKLDTCFVHLTDNTDKVFNAAKETEKRRKKWDVHEYCKEDYNCWKTRVTTASHQKLAKGIISLLPSDASNLATRDLADKLQKTARVLELRFNHSLRFCLGVWLDEQGWAVYDTTLSQFSPY